MVMIETISVVIAPHVVAAGDAIAVRLTTSNVMMGGFVLLKLLRI